MLTITFSKKISLKSQVTYMFINFETYGIFLFLFLLKFLIENYSFSCIQILFIFLQFIIFLIKFITVANLIICINSQKDDEMKENQIKRSSSFKNKDKIV